MVSSLAGMAVGAINPLLRLARSLMGQ
jgi:hypothetical protein